MKICKFFQLRDWFCHIIHKDWNLSHIKKIGNDLRVQSSCLQVPVLNSCPASLTDEQWLGRVRWNEPFPLQGALVSEAESKNTFNLCLSLWEHFATETQSSELFLSPWCADCCGGVCTQDNCAAQDSCPQQHVVTSISYCCSASPSCCTVYPGSLYSQ